MVVELADNHKNKNKRKRVRVDGYDRSANHVPSYSRRWPRLNDSSLFSFKLADLATQKIVNICYVRVPDPGNCKAPRLVRSDVFAGLNDEEFNKLVAYITPFNSEETMELFMCSTLADGEIEEIQQGDTAVDAVNNVFIIDPDGKYVVEAEPFWDKKILGLKYKEAVPLAIGLYAILRK